MPPHTTKLTLKVISEEAAADIMRKAQERALYNRVVKDVTFLLDESPELVVSSKPVLDFMSGVEQLRVAKELKKQDSKYYRWITINPDDELITPPEIIAKCEKLFRAPWCDSYHFVIEQRSEVLSEAKGFHIHALVRTGEPPSNVHQKVYKCFQNYCGGKKHVIVKVKSKEQGDNLLSGYMVGIKKGDHKMILSSIDKQWREISNFKSMYHS